MVNKSYMLPVITIRQPGFYRPSQTTFTLILHIGPFVGNAFHDRQIRPLLYLF